MTGVAASLEAARAAFDGRRYREAAALYEALVEGAPHNPEFLLLSARASLLDRHFEDALLRSIRAAHRVPEQEAAYEMWADAARAVGDLKEAVAAWEALLERRPENAEARQRLIEARRRAEACPAPLR